jgi:mannose-6-phosphate isomerase-like protein (cupin superfamily)
MNLIRREPLPFVGMSHEFVGKDHGVAASIFFVTAPPGGKVRLHWHDYDEVIIVQEGRALCTVGNEQGEARAGNVIAIPAGTPHGFTNVGEAPLVTIDIHDSPEFVSHWLEGA